MQRERTGRGQLRAQRAVREQRLPRLAAHGAIRRHRQGARRRCRAASRRGASTTCSTPRTASRSSSPSSPTRNGARSARRSACRTCWPIHRSRPIRCASPRATACIPRLRDLFRKLHARRKRASICDKASRRLRADHAAGRTVRRSAPQRSPARWSRSPLPDGGTTPAAGTAAGDGRPPPAAAARRAAARRAQRGNRGGDRLRCGDDRGVNRRRRAAGGGARRCQSNRQRNDEG